jgi:hypothetical protein
VGRTPAPLAPGLLPPAAVLVVASHPHPRAVRKQPRRAAHDKPGCCAVPSRPPCTRRSTVCQPPPSSSSTCPAAPATSRAAASLAAATAARRLLRAQTPSLSTTRTGEPSVEAGGVEREERGQERVCLVAHCCASPNAAAAHTRGVLVVYTYSRGDDCSGDKDTRTAVALAGLRATGWNLGWLVGGGPGGSGGCLRAPSALESTPGAVTTFLGCVTPRVGERSARLSCRLLWKTSTCQPEGQAGTSV